MYIINKVKIEKLWGNKDLEFIFDKNFNFLIGENGTGKTTIINLIAAVLMVDIARLNKNKFEKITIYLKKDRENKIPSISVRSFLNEDKLFGLEYGVKESQKSEEKIFNLDYLDTDRIYRKMPRLIYENRYSVEHVELKKEIDRYLNVNWLSVHRNIEKYNIDNEEVYRPAIDIKLENLNNEVSKYFSILSKKYADEVLEFQKKTLLSVLTSEKENNLNAFWENIDTDKERKLLADMLSILGVEEKKYKEKINVHLEKFTKATEFRKQNEGRLRFDDILSLMNVWRSHSLVIEYEKLQNQKNKIFSPKTDFVNIINTLFSGRKIISISEKNEINVQVLSKDKSFPISIFELSSGEKQLLIILGQAILQKGHPTIYIADEPELSLHLKWQNELTNAIHELNQNCQIIFATHSPDIVASYQNKIIRMEDYI